MPCLGTFFFGEIHFGFKPGMATASSVANKSRNRRLLLFSQVFTLRYNTWHLALRDCLVRGAVIHPPTLTLPQQLSNGMTAKEEEEESTNYAERKNSFVHLIALRRGTESVSFLHTVTRGEAGGGWKNNPEKRVTVKDMNCNYKLTFAYIIPLLIVLVKNSVVILLSRGGWNATVSSHAKGMLSVALMIHNPYGEWWRKIR